jgi:GT2 family glycosyltransferase
VNLPAGPHRVAVILVNYRSYQELGDCLLSIEQSRAQVQAVVIDQASDRREAAEIQARFPWVDVVSLERNTGFAAGVNAGAKRAATPYLLLLNPDSAVEPDMVGELTTWMDQHPDVGIAGPRLLNDDGTLQESARMFPDFTTGLAGRSSWLTRVLPNNRLSRRNLRARDSSNGSTLDVDWLSGACLMIRREAFDAVGGMDEGFFLYWEDADFCRRVTQAGWRTVYVPTVRARHTGGRSARHASAASLRAFHRSAFRLFWKHSTAPARALAPLVFLALQGRLALLRIRSWKRG